MSRKQIGLLALPLALAVLATALYPTHVEAGGKGNDRVLSKVRFIHYRKGHAKPPWASGGKDKRPDQDGYYTYIAKGAKWKSPEGFLLNPRFAQNAAGDMDDLIHSAVAAGLAEWEVADSLQVFDNEDADSGASIDEGVAYDDGAYRGYNTVSFGSYADDGVIGVAMVWGYFTGPPGKREILEAHVLLNDSFAWGDASTDDTLMDVENIITHELGHAAGMGDLYEVAAGDETMYGYSDEGETKKRDLYVGDTAGITGLYN